MDYTLCYTCKDKIDIVQKFNIPMIGDYITYPQIYYRKEL